MAANPFSFNNLVSVIFFCLIIDLRWTYIISPNYYLDKYFYRLTKILIQKQISADDVYHRRKFKNWP